MKLYWSLLFVPLLVGCAAHAPMSELVMFDRSTVPDSANTYKSGTITYFQPGITGSQFKEIRPGDYASYTDGEFPSVTIQTLTLTDQGKARSISIGRGTGIDWTSKLKPDHYGSLAVSFPHSFKLSVHRVLLNRGWSGFSAGIFSGVDTRRYYQGCNEYEDSCYFWPNASAFLFNSGIRSRFLIRDPRSPGLVFTGALEVGYIWSGAQPFVGFNVSVTSLH